MALWDAFQPGAKTPEETYRVMCRAASAIAYSATTVFPALV